MIDKYKYNKRVFFYEHINTSNNNKMFLYNYFFFLIYCLIFISVKILFIKNFILNQMF